MSCRWNSHDRKTYIWLRTYHSLIFFVPHDSKSGMLLFISSHIEKRTWSQLLSLVPRFKGLRIAQSVETSNADQPHERYVYNNTHWQKDTPLAVLYQWSVNNYTLQGAFPLLCSWLTVWSCEVLESSKPKRPENAFFNKFFLARRQRTF